MTFKNSNVAAGLPANNSSFQVGVSDVDTSAAGANQKGVILPFPGNPEFTWLYYECTVTTILDSGTVVHNRLPQVNSLPDTLSSIDLDSPLLAKSLGPGVNMRCTDQYEDIIQRMGHARYWFRLWGQAMRVGYQVPIPAIRYIGGVQAVPYDKNPQWAFNRIKPGSNYGGFIVWQAAWSLWYTTLTPPVSNTFPAADPSVGVVGGGAFQPLPKGLQLPFTQPDDNAVAAGPGGIGGGIPITKPLPPG